MEIGLRELRQQASELVRRVERGESITVTVSGRPAARLVPVVQGAWVDARELSALYAGGLTDPRWVDDRERLDTGLRDPFPA